MRTPDTVFSWVKGGVMNNLVSRGILCKKISIPCSYHKVKAYILIYCLVKRRTKTHKDDSFLVTVGEQTPK
jgi:hypothetical protein